MFEYEWHILEKEVMYESNTGTEVDIITKFRKLIILISVSEVLYFIYIINIIDHFKIFIS